ncbi:MAG: GNAT family N-acetyltransferase [Nocardiopsaceae bacterium]|nr:GNAT family N-acetyltransferase [Nocardiopsaceae bacterium]
MRIERWDPADTATALALYEVYRAAELADDPVSPPDSAGVFRAHLAGSWEGAQGEVWYVPGADGGAVGFYRLDLPDLENTGRAALDLVVHPAARRRGIGRELLRHAAERAAASGREFLDSGLLADSAGEAFAKRLGAAFTLEEVRRVQYLNKIPPGTVASLRAEAARKAAGYSLASWREPPPEEYLAGIAGVLNAFGDAPRGEGVEAAAWDADRVRQRTGRLAREGHWRAYAVAALHDESGEMAAFTRVTVDPEQPGWGHQQVTAVTRSHRGHRLGLLVKTAMLEWLADAEPELERIETGNAASNDHMIAVNEALGYEVVAPSWKMYEIPVHAALGV